ncbi:MAG TPA: thioredoxin domain-containing protein [Actinomycetota bacterium]
MRRCNAACGVRYGARVVNRLKDATSPYLLQHAENPVDWYEWGPEALDRARAEDKPILLSVGYAACHWCHVMAHESFEDAQTARLMNERFVCVKVDREERPDVDGVYMAAVQAMTGQGGWPMTVFLTPAGEPFWGGTYFPPEPRHGMPSFRDVLAAIHDAWTTKRDAVLAQSADITAHIDRAAALPSASGEPSGETLANATRSMLEQLDPEWGGFGGAPKFPQPMTLEFLLRMHLAGAEGALGAVTLTLDRMARGGIFDQVGGGFHRYAVDRIWLVPHFEKMLYDNAQLLRLYARAWQVTGSPLYRETAERTADFLLAEMRHPDGGLFASLDADSDGAEGTFYVWPYEEIIAIAGDDMPVAVAAFALSGSGNWEGVNVLWRPDPDEAIAAEAGIGAGELRAALDRVRTRLAEARAQRPRPATDDKVIASWNGMAIAALAEAGRVFGRTDFLAAAETAARFVLGRMRREDGRLLRSWREGRTSGPAFLDDYAHMADACLTLYETTFEPSWWREARALGEAMLALFAGDRGFADQGVDAEPLVVRPRDPFDNATPSGSSAACDVLLRIGALSGEPAPAAPVAAFLATAGSLAARAPLAFGNALCAVDRMLSPGREIAVVGTPGEPDARALVEAAHGRYIPNRVIAAGEPGSTEPALLRDRPQVGGSATAYVCENFLCRRPVTRPEELAALLG